jgi:tetratricopeptide (TPR) repeat protein
MNLLRISRSTEPVALAMPVTLVVMVSMLASCAFTREQKLARAIQRGEQYLAAEDYARAAVEFRNGLDLDAKNVDLHHKIGQAYLGQRRIPDAVKAFRRALELDPNRRDSGLKLAQILAASGDRTILGDALEQAKKDISAQPGSSAALDTLALLELRLGKLSEAEEHLEEALEKSPADVQAAIALSGIRLSQQDQAGAEKVLRDAIRSNSKEPRGYIALARMLVRLGRRDEARQNYATVIEQDPNNPAALLGLARLHMQARQLEEADKTYRKLAALPDKRYRPLHALFLLETGRLGESVQELEQIRKKDPKDRIARSYLIAAYSQVGRREDAVKLIEQGLADNPRDIDLLLGRSRLSTLAGDYAAAERALNQVLKLTPDSAVAFYLMAQVKERKGEITAQKQNLGNALSLDRNLLAARFDLALLLAQSGARTSALQLIDEAPKQQQATRRFVVCRNWVLVALQDWDGLAEGVRHGMALWKDHELLLQDGLVKLEAKRYAQARQSFEEVLQGDPGNFQAVQGLARSYLAEGQLATALARVREHAAARPKSAAAQHLLGTVLLAQGKPDDAIGAFESAKRINPAYVFADITLAQSQIAARDLSGARRTLTTLLASHPTTVAARLLLGSVEELSGNLSGAIEQYQQAVELTPNNPVALNNLAYLLSSQPSRLDEAYNYARRAVDGNPDELAYQDTLGWILCLRGQFAEAVKHLEKASRLNVATVQYHLAFAYIKAGNRAQGGKTLEKAIQMDPVAPEAKLVLQAMR